MLQSLSNIVRKVRRALPLSLQLRHVDKHGQKRRIDPAKRRIDSDARIIVLGLDRTFLELVVAVEAGGRERRFWSLVGSPLVLISIAALILFFPKGTEPALEITEITPGPHIVLYLPDPSTYRNITKPGGGGGGGGARNPKPAAHGKALDIKLRQMVPPTNRKPPEEPEIPEPPSLAGAIEAKAIEPILPTDIIGDPGAGLLDPPPSEGPGGNAGIGDGHGSGIGKGEGAGYGEGQGGGTGGGTGGGIGDEAGSGVSIYSPELISAPLPEPDTANIQLNRRLYEMKGQLIFFLLYVKPDGTVQDVRIYPYQGKLGTGDNELDRVLMEHVKKTWKVKAYRTRTNPDGSKKKEFATETVSVQLAIGIRPY